MTVAFELPEVGEPKWADDERDTVEVDGFSYRVYYLDSMADEVRDSLARLLVAQEFVASEREKSRLDCAGERAFAVDLKYRLTNPFDRTSWDELIEATRNRWIAIAKAVLDGEH